MTVTYAGFHDVLFPSEIGLGSSGGPEWKTEIGVTDSGLEQRNARWADPLRRYVVQWGNKIPDDLYEMLVFSLERGGRLNAFRFQDLQDYQADSQTLTHIDVSGTPTFQMIKRYGTYYVRTLQLLVSGTVKVWVNGVAKTLGSGFTVDLLTGIISIPSWTNGQVVTASCEFHVPCRFDTDFLDVRSTDQTNGSIVIPIVEVRLPEPVYS
jgi:uncharacterized protein (TIGR02217 family)